ncbi:cell wall anchor protein [Ensifer sp. T173]|uniref:Cell wall anchor protein n=1 Tax=Ensifer canadensis TaxID=555315 RepID=A0AAW4FHN6_9HYPH|nr:cell wall anchor protein [Ensifer canadensis]MBM3091622.1 cell wall anchor protein [Ensifer canadensis]UBI74392.1 cell wall anchor protein [Ensifer canadensis]
MRSLIIVSAAALVLSACTTTTGSIDTAIQKNLPQICSAAATAHSAFVVVASTGNIKPRTVAREAVAWEALETVCKDPGSVTAATALVKAAEAYAAITLAVREAKAAS